MFTCKCFNNTFRLLARWIFSKHPRVWLKFTKLLHWKRFKKSGEKLGKIISNFNSDRTELGVSRTRKNTTNYVTQRISEMAPGNRIFRRFERNLLTGGDGESQGTYSIGRTPMRNNHEGAEIGVPKGEYLRKPLHRDVPTSAAPPLQFGGRRWRAVTARRTPRY